MARPSKGREPRHTACMTVGFKPVIPSFRTRLQSGPGQDTRAKGQVMSSQDLDLNCGVRNVLTRHWIDPTKTNLFVRKGHVHMSGEASMVGVPRPGQETAEALKALESDVRRLHEVKSVSFEFTNWVRNDSGAWICRDRKKTSDESPATRNGDSNETANSD